MVSICEREEGGKFGGMLEPIEGFETPGFKIFTDVFDFGAMKIIEASPGTNVSAALGPESQDNDAQTSLVENTVEPLWVTTPVEPLALVNLDEMEEPEEENAAEEVCAAAIQAAQRAMAVLAKGSNKANAPIIEALKSLAALVKGTSAEGLPAAKGKS